MPEVLIIDFHDSFTYNIAGEVLKLGLDCEVIDFNQIDSLLKVVRKEKAKRRVIIWGPGPGHPDEYLKSQKQLLSLINDKHILNLGICLGHQLFWRALGAKVNKHSLPLHGQAVSLQIPTLDLLGNKNELEVSIQFYNSLYISYSENKNLIKKYQAKIFQHSDQLLLSSFGQVISYQFHPESIGTSYPQLFFTPILKFIYNSNIPIKNNGDIC